MKLSSQGGRPLGTLHGLGYRHFAYFTEQP